MLLKIILNMFIEVSPPEFNRLYSLEMWYRIEVLVLDTDKDVEIYDRGSIATAQLEDKQDSYFRQCFHSSSLLTIRGSALWGSTTASGTNF